MAERFASKVIYYGGYPGSSGKPVRGRLGWRDGVLLFEPRTGPAPRLRIEGRRLVSVRREEEGMTGARRVRLLIDVQTEDGKPPAAVKFEIGSLLLKERKLQRWVELLGRVCGKRKDHNG